MLLCMMASTIPMQEFPWRISATLIQTETRIIHRRATAGNLVFARAEDGIIVDVLIVKRDERYRDDGASTLKSNDATLKNITVEGVTLNETFSPKVTAYTATVENEVETVAVGAAANHDKAVISGTGDKTLAVGENVIPISVKAEDGTNHVIYIDDYEKMLPAMQI